MFRRKKEPKVADYESKTYDSPEARTKGIQEGIKKDKRQATINHLIKTGILTTAISTLAYLNGNFNPNKPTVIGTNPQRDISEIVTTSQEVYQTNEVPFPIAVQAAIKIQKGERKEAEHYLTESNVTSILDKCDSLETFQSVKPKEKVTGRELQNLDPRLEDFFKRGINLEDFKPNKIQALKYSFQRE
jgi:hypothetical protein